MKISSAIRRHAHFDEGPLSETKGPEPTFRLLEGSDIAVCRPCARILEKDLRGYEVSNSRGNRVFALFLLLSGLIHGMLLAGNPHWFQREPLQVIDLDLLPSAEPTAAQVKPSAPAPSLAMPDVQPQPRERPKPAESLPEPKPEPKPLQRVETAKKVKKPEPKPASSNAVHEAKQTAEPNVPDAAPSTASETAALGRPQGPPAYTSGETEDVLKLFLAQVRQRVDRFKNYPYAARRRQEEGRVTLRFVIRPDGTLEGLEVVKSSSSKLLDEAAVKAVRDAAPFPGFPREVVNRPLAVEIGLVFQLT